MSFASPLAFALTAVAIPIVIFYILKVRMRRVRVSTNLFWKQIYDEKPPRSIWQYLRHLLSLLTQLLLVALLVLAVADPSFSWQLLQARRIVAVIDSSASMRATDVASNRFEAAIQEALATANGLRFRDEMAIILAGHEPEVVVGMSGHVPTLKRALHSIKVTDNPTQLAAAIDLAKQLIGTHPHGQILVFTDGCCGLGDERIAAIESRDLKVERSADSADAKTTKQVDDLARGKFDAKRDSQSQLQHKSTHSTTVEYRIVGSQKTGNIGITQFQVRRSLIDPLGYEILAIVKNASPHHVQGRLELELDGAPVDVLPLDLEPDEVFTRALEKTSLEGGVLIANLTELAVASGSDMSGTGQANTEPAINGLTTDDHAWAVLPSREIQDVLLVSPGNLFLQKVFEANPLVRITVQTEFPATWPTDSIVVLHQNIPEKLPNNNVFIVDPLNSTDAWSLGDSIANPIITDQDKDSPLMTHVRLDNVLMPQAKQLEFLDPPRVLAGAVSGEAIYAEVKRPVGKCLVLSVDINEGDLTFRTAFPIMVTNALGWFAGQNGELRQSLTTGAVAQVRMDDSNLASDQELWLRSPSGETQRLPRNEVSDDSQVSIPPLSQCGVWTIAMDEPSKPMMQLAINLANDAESDLRTLIESNQKNSPALVAGWFTRPIWFYLTAAACLLTISEWWLYQRRMIT